MAVKIRLQRKGRKQKPFYHIVVADSRSPRDGRFITRIGSYNPLTVPATIDLDREEAYKWLMNGAQPTETARAILKFKGIYFKKHLQRGVAKGAMTQEEADKQYQAWIDTKDQRIEKRKEQTASDLEARRMKIFGVKKDKPKVVAPEAPEVEENAGDDSAE